MTYFPEQFTHPFTPDQREIGKAIITGISEGGQRARAAPRGTGKSTIAEAILTYAVNYGLLRFPLLIGANGIFAEDRLAGIRMLYERSEKLAEDFPEICYPVACLEGAAQRARMQTFEGVRTLLTWGKHMIILPMIPGSQSAGAIIGCKGIEGAIRGLKINSLRPDFCLMDDLDTRESAYSPTETKKRRETIEQDVMGLAGQYKSMSMVILCSIFKKSCLADQFTDRKVKPAFQGVRQRLLIAMPENENLWQKYIEIRQIDQMDDKGTGPTANKFYMDNREAMDEGAVVSNEYRFLSDIGEISALQHCYNVIADFGWENFACEYQNEPPDDEAAETSGLDIAAVCKKINAMERGVIPGWCERLTAFIDVHGRQLYWCVMAWKAGLQGYVVDYGTEVVYGPTGSLKDADNQKDLDSAILAALMSWRDWEAETGWPMADTGEVKHVDLCGVDAGYKSDVVERFVRSSPGGKYRATMGFGSAQPKRYKAPRKSSKTVAVASHYYASRTATVSMLWSMDADFFKNSVHNGILAPANTAGSISLFGSDPIIHRQFAEQITAEIWTREFVGGAGRGFKEYFNVKSRHNHWLDCTAGAIAMATMLGIRLFNVMPGGAKKQRRVGRMNGR